MTNWMTRLVFIRLLKLLLVSLIVSIFSFGLFGGLNFLAPPTQELDKSLPKKTEPFLSQLTKLNWIRTASAATLDGELDGIADNIWGQLDFSSDSEPVEATNTTLNQPSAIFVYDLTGQIFIADTAYNRVLIWESIDVYENGDPASVVLGQSNFTTTEVLDPPTAASMNAPKGVTVGFDGLVYVADTGNNRILVFFPLNYSDDEYIPGESYPEFEDGMEADYVLGQTDMTRNALAPTAVDTLSQPQGLVTDVNDNLVVADTGNNRVLIYTWPFTDGKFASFILGQEAEDNLLLTQANAAPNPPTQRSMNMPTGVAAGPLGDEIYVADTGNNRVLVFTDDPLDGTADAVIGQPNFVSNTPNNGGVSKASLNHPTGLKMDAGGRLFVADSYNHRVLVIDRATQDITASAVFGQENFSGSAPNSGGISATSLYTPTAVATDSFYMDVYIADSGNHRALNYNQPIANPLPIIGELEPGTVPPGRTDFSFLDYGSEGKFELAIWGSGIISDTVIEVNGIPRSTGTDFLGLAYTEIQASDVVTTGVLTITLRNPAPGGGISAPFIMKIYEPLPGDNLADIVLGQQSFSNDDGPFVHTSNKSLFEPSGVTVEPASGRVFVADTGNARVLSWPNRATQTEGGKADLVIGKPDFTTYFYDEAPGRNLSRPVGVALDNDGNLYVADAEENLVLVYTAPFTNNMPAALIISGLNNPVALALDNQDNLYVADTFNHRILFYTTPLASNDTSPDRVIGQPDLVSTSPNAGGTVSAEGLFYPSGIALDKAGNLYVADSNNHRVLLYRDPLGTDAIADLVFGQSGDFTTGVSNKGGISAATLNYPYGLLVDDNGNLYVADMDNNRVLGFARPLTTDLVADLVLGQAGSFGDNQANMVRSAAEASSPRGPDTLRAPTAIGMNGEGGIFVVDSGNNRVLKFQNVPSLAVEPKLYLPNTSR